MSRLRPRSLLSIFVLVAASAQLVVANELVFAGTLPLISQSHGHGHPVTFQGHDGHVDVVLHHESETPPASGSLNAEPVHGEDHVLHVAGADLSAKQWNEGPPAAVVLTRQYESAGAMPPTASLVRSWAITARSLPDGLRTTVLRL